MKRNTITRVHVWEHNGSIIFTLAGSPAFNPGEMAGKENEKPMYLADMRPSKRFRPSSQDAQVPSQISLSAETLKLGDTMRLESHGSLPGSTSSLGSEAPMKLSPKALFPSPLGAALPPQAGKSPGNKCWKDHPKRDVSPSVARM